MPKQPPGDDNVGRMQFLLGLRGISDPAVLRAMDEVPREHFVENSFIESAYADQALPIACGQTISQPYVVAFMSEHLGVQPSHRVLEVGTGSGYQAAILSGSRARWSASSATGRWPRPRGTRLRTLGYDNVDVRVGMASPACRTARPTIGSSSPPPPRPFPTPERARRRRVMVLPLGPHAGPQQLIKLTKGEQGIKQEPLIGVRFVPLLPGTAREL